MMNCIIDWTIRLKQFNVFNVLMVWNIGGFKQIGNKSQNDLSFTKIYYIALESIDWNRMSNSLI